VDKSVEAHSEDVSARKTFGHWKDITVRIINTLDLYVCVLPTPVAARSKAWVCGPRLLVLRTRIPPEVDVFFLVSIVYCHVEVSGTGRSLVKRNPRVWCV
jgi:hypothetical protein